MQNAQITNNITQMPQNSNYYLNTMQIVTENLVEIY